jgi:tripartite-type tricarboxylate transporter receptor subunit TctC
VVPFGPGGANDLIARAAAEAVSKRVGQPVVIENKPGAGTLIGADYVAKAKPDGYTWLIGAASVVTNSMLRSDMPTPMATWFLPDDRRRAIGHRRQSARAGGNPDPTRAKTRPGGVDWATAGSGSTPHFVAEMLREVGVSIVIVPYKSDSEGVTAVISNNVPATSEASIIVLPQVKGGKLKAIATTYNKRITAYNTLPTAIEQGFPGIQIGHWAGLYAPKGTPPAIVERMSKELEAAVRSADFRDRMVPSVSRPEPGTTVAFVAFICCRGASGWAAKSANMQADK